MKSILTISFVLLISQFVFAQTKIDGYGRLISEDESSRLHEISKDFSNTKDSKIFILINKANKMPFGEFVRYFYGVKHWLILNGVSKDLIIMQSGEETESQKTQIWFVKNSENVPFAKEVSIDQKLQEKINMKTLFDTNCIDCDESPFVKLFIFREGVDYLAKALQSNPKSKALLKIARVEYLSRTKKERTELMSGIFNRLKENQISKDRVLIQFTSGIEAKFYLVPISKK